MSPSQIANQREAVRQESRAEPWDFAVAITAAVDGVYPSSATSANVYGIIFQTTSFLPSPGFQPLNRKAHSPEVKDSVCNLWPYYIPEGTILPVWRCRGYWYTMWRD